MDEETRNLLWSAFTAGWSAHKDFTTARSEYIAHLYIDAMFEQYLKESTNGSK